MNVRWEEKNNAKANQSKFLAIWDAVGGVDPRRLSHKHLAFITMRRRRPTSTARTHKTAQNETINVISTSWPVSNEVLWFICVIILFSKQIRTTEWIYKVSCVMCHDSSVTIAQWVCRSKPKLIERKHYHSKLRNTIDCGWGQTPDCVTASSRSLFGCSDPQRFNKWAYRARDHIEWQTTSVRLVWKSRYRPRMSSLCRRCNIELAAGPVGLSHVIGAPSRAPEPCNGYPLIYESFKGIQTCG